MFDPIIKNLLELIYWDYYLNLTFLDLLVLKAREYEWVCFLSYPLIILTWCITTYRLRKDYKTENERSKINSILMMISYHSYSLLIIFSSWCNLWRIPMEAGLYFIMLIIGSLIFSVFGIFYLKVEFQIHSIKWSIGLDTQELITTGVFKNTRNPHSVSKGFAQVGLGIMGGSIYAIFISLLWWIFNHFNVLLEEKLLRKLFGQSFVEYCEKTPRYFNLFNNS